MRSFVLFGTISHFLVIELTGILIWSFWSLEKTHSTFDIIPVPLVPWTLFLIILEVWSIRIIRLF